jgi:hypothetical protein
MSRTRTRRRGSHTIAQVAAAGSAEFPYSGPPFPSLPSQAPTQTVPQQYSSDTSNLPPLPSTHKGKLRLPPTAPLTWTFMITYLVFMLVIPIIALLVS